MSAISNWPELSLIVWRLPSVVQLVADCRQRITPASDTGTCFPSAIVPVSVPVVICGVGAKVGLAVALAVATTEASGIGVTVDPPLQATRPRLAAAMNSTRI